jgi:hypothetical protein
VTNPYWSNSGLARELRLAIPAMTTPLRMGMLTAHPHP